MTHFIFDCDDVLLDWQGAFIKFCARHGLILDLAGPNAFDMQEWTGLSPEAIQLLVSAFNNSPGFAHLMPRPDAVDTVWRLHDAGHTVSVLTACGTGRSSARARVSNLNVSFGYEKRPDLSAFNGGIEILPLNASKFEHLYNISRKTGDLVYVEDAYHHAVSGAVNGIKTYCLRRSHNRHHEGAHDSRIIWIDRLTEVLP